jgi:hypothetical protein
MEVSSKGGRLNGIESFAGAEILDRINHSPFGKTQNSSCLTSNAESLNKIFKVGHGNNDGSTKDGNTLLLQDSNAKSDTCQTIDFPNTSTFSIDQTSLSLINTSKE